METIITLAPCVLLLPFLMFIFLGLTSYKWTGKQAGMIGTAGITVVTFCCFFIALSYFFGGIGKPDGADAYQTLTVFNMEWMKMSAAHPGLTISIGFLLDPISAMMLIVISTVSLMVHIYSFGYMFEHGHYDEGMQRYYCVLSLFTFAMLGLVLATNIFQMYIFWELVGVSSFLLIGYYYKKPSAISACKKAFIVTRFADMFYLIGILIVSYYTKTFDFMELNAVAENGHTLVGNSMQGLTFMGLSLTTLALFLIFLGGAGKSAMFPFHIWLPDAMEGPTPSSALIHAATMVVAGVYLVARLFPVFAIDAPDALTAITYIGAFTALFAAVIAVAQTDIKRVLAFSTISQIAFMMVALGVARFSIEGIPGHVETSLGFTAAMWHLFTHAMFKAMLFLCCGCIIHCVESNEMAKMGGLKKYMPITCACFLIGCLAIAGIPPFSGFFSKGEILSACMENGQTGIYVIMTFTAGLTAFYMFRLFYHIFYYEDNKEIETSAHKPHDQKWPMTMPLVVFATLSVVSGFFPFGKLVTASHEAMEIEINWPVEIVSVVVALTGILIARFLYKKKNDMPEKIMAKCQGLCNAASHRFYIDEVWYGITRSFIFGIICKSIAWFDRHCIDGFMDLMGWLTNRASSESREFQSGNVQQYAWVFVMGVIVIGAFALYF